MSVTQTDRDLTQITSVVTNTRLAGLHYDEDLDSVRIFRFCDTRESQIEDAKRAAETKLGKVTIDLVSISPSDLPPEHQPGINRGWLEAVRWITQNKEARRVHATSGELIGNMSGGVYIDLSTAHCMAQVYDAITDGKMKDRFNKLPVVKAAKVAWGMMQ